MKKSLNIVLIGVLAIASIILALPFTPLRNSFKGVTSNLTDQAMTAMGVDLNGKIKNARLVSKAHQYEVSDNDLAVNVDSKGRVIKSSTYSNNFSGISDGSMYSASEMIMNNKNSEGNSGAGAGLGLGIGGSKQSSTGSSQGIGGFVAVSAKLGTTATTTTPNGGTTKQGANGDNNGTGGGTHPGVDPPGFPSLPIGNGTSSMLIFALAFGIWKMRKTLV